MRPPSGLLQYMLQACVAQILLEKSYLHVESFLRAINACRVGERYHAPLWPCNKVLKPNFQSVISRTNNDCSLLSLILAKLLLLHIRCENIFALSIVTALTECPFSTKKCAEMSVFFYVETAEIRWRLKASPPDPRLCPLLCQIQILGALPPPLENFCIRHWLQLLLV